MVWWRPSGGVIEGNNGGHTSPLARKGCFIVSVDTGQHKLLCSKYCTVNIKFSYLVRFEPVSGKEQSDFKGVSYFIQGLLYLSSSGKLLRPIKQESG